MSDDARIVDADLERRDDAGVGGAVHPDARRSAGEAQAGPAMDVDAVSNGEKIDGIVAQTRVDVGDAGAERIADVLRQRFSDAGIDVPDEERGALAARIADGA